MALFTESITPSLVSLFTVSLPFLSQVIHHFSSSFPIFINLPVWLYPPSLLFLSLCFPPPRSFILRLSPFSIFSQLFSSSHLSLPYESSSLCLSNRLSARPPSLPASHSPTTHSPCLPPGLNLVMAYWALGFQAGRTLSSLDCTVSSRGLWVRLGVGLGLHAFIKFVQRCVCVHDRRLILFSLTQFIVLVGEADVRKVCHDG